MDEVLRRSGHLDSIELNMKSFLASSSSDLIAEKKLNETSLKNLELEIENVFNKGWKKTTAIAQKRHLRRIFDCLYYMSEGLKTYYYLVASKEERAGEQNSSAFSKSSKIIFSKASNQMLSGSSDVTIGALDRTRTCNPSVRSRIFYPIELRVHILKIKNRVN